MLAKQNKNHKKSTELIYLLLESFGEDPQRNGLKETPTRVIRMYKELLRGYSQNPKLVFKLFDSNGYKDMITVADIDFYSLCEHHLVPFFGKVHIGYVPNGKIVGLSKFARVVEIFARRLQTQENLTKQIFDFIKENLHPQGVIVMVEAEHLCVSMRGIRKKGIIAKTTMKNSLMEKRKDLIRQFYRDVQIQRR